MESFINDQEYAKGLREDGVFDVNKYVVSKMAMMVCETSTSPSQMVLMLMKRAERIRDGYCVTAK